MIVDDILARGPIEHVSQVFDKMGTTFDCTDPNMLTKDTSISFLGFRLTVEDTGEGIAD